MSSSKYEIQFSGLANGIHEFSWTLEPSFFEEETLDDIKEADLSVKLELKKNERMLNLNFHITGKVKCLCDRCGDECWIDINNVSNLIARFAQETNFTDDEVIFLSPAEYKLDTKQFIYEYALLNLPVKKTHSDGECDSQVLTYLQSEMEEKLEQNDKDPRWKALEKLKNNA